MASRLCRLIKNMSVKTVENFKGELCMLELSRESLRSENCILSNALGLLLLFSALETFLIIALYKSTFTIPYHTILLCLCGQWMSLGVCAILFFYFTSTDSGKSTTVTAISASSAVLQQDLRLHMQELRIFLGRQILLQWGRWGGRWLRRENVLVLLFKWSGCSAFLCSRTLRTTLCKAVVYNVPLMCLTREFITTVLLLCVGLCGVCCSSVE